MGTTGALGLPLGGGGAHRPPTPQCWKPEEWGDQWAGAGRNRVGSRYRPARSSAPPLGQLRLRRALPAPENQAFGPCRGRCGSRARGSWSQPAFVRVPTAPVRQDTCTGLGAEFATHLKVARNWALPNPRSPARGAGAVRPRRGRGEVREVRGLPLKVAVRLRLVDGARRLSSPPNGKDLGVGSGNKKVRTFLVVQWLRIRLPIQGTRVLSPGPGRSHVPRSK